MGPQSIASVPICDIDCAGAAFDVSRDTARTSQSRAELSREYRKTGSAVVSRAQLGAQTHEYAEERRRARAFTSLPAVSGDLRGQLRSGMPPASSGQEVADGQVWLVLCHVSSSM